MVMRQLILEATCPSTYDPKFDLFQNNDNGRKASLAGFNGVENLLTPFSMPHFGDDPSINLFQPEVVDYVLGTFTPSSTLGNSDFNNSFGNPSYFTSAINGYNLKYGGSKKYYAATKYAPSIGLNKYYPDSGILSE
jgi:hypothetical protein